MTKRCSTKVGSEPPVCSVHNVKLEAHKTSDATITANVGKFTFHVCPVSGQVVRDPETTS